MSAQRVDVVVLGGGAMGSAAAWQLARRGVDTVLLERFAAGHTRGASHGASRIFRLVYPDVGYIRLAQRALVGWRELEDLAGVPLLTVTGGLEHGADPVLDQVAEAAASAGVGARWLAPRDAAARWPGLRFDTRVLFHPDSGRLHADRSVTALQENAAKHGAEVRHETPVNTVTIRDEDAVEVRTDDDVYLARRVIVAAGAWTAKLLGGVVPLPALRVTQEQPAHFAPLAPAGAAGADGGGAADAGAGWPSFVHLLAAGTREAVSFHGGVYGLYTPGGGIKVGFHGVGPVVDPDRRDFTAEPTQLAALREYVRRWLPGADPDSYHPISCTYTTTPDSHFVLDRHGPVVVAAGFSGHGFKFVPAIGAILADLAIEGTRPDPRFASTR
ncbi:FAD-dependent oxidoreductase [Frankia canadensis]|uniref:FAD-dependent oxidoreductase n=1 Tax=Frankia canadensis TaxID=1836972 RepID=A0A2I2KZK3_9ACTN|nr:FAD-dependent oxidoreductase [Frankia canadensis]SNQ51085.1 FAD-dependent oxidoreductase [Frankia canadensis]SOU58375.1 FAD-dependent oxidoreductase [Frankia canadensis]